MVPEHSSACSCADHDRHACRSSDEAASGQENLCTPNHDAWPSHSFATPARRPLSEVDDNQNAQVTGFSATPRPPAGQRVPVGSQTLPVLRTGMPTGQQELPVTPKTAPRAFVPSTPTKSGRPAVTPMSVAAFRRRRSALARSMFQECAFYHHAEDCGCQKACIYLCFA